MDNFASHVFVRANSDNEKEADVETTDSHHRQIATSSDSMTSSSTPEHQPQPPSDLQTTLARHFMRMLQEHDRVRLQLLKRHLHVKAFRASGLVS